MERLCEEQQLGLELYDLPSTLTANSTGAPQRLAKAGEAAAFALGAAPIEFVVSVDGKS